MIINVKLCTKSKLTKQSFKSVSMRSNELLGLIHSNLANFRSTPSRDGKHYNIFFIDNYSKFCYVYLIHSKDEALDIFKIYKAKVENQLERKIRGLILYTRGKYELKAFSYFCVKYIVHQTTTS